MAFKVLQWYICRMEGWFAADADSISVQSWDEVIMRGGFGGSVGRWFGAVTGQWMRLS